MDIHKQGKLLLDKVGNLTSGIETCILKLSVKDFVALQNVVTNLYNFHHEYTKGWDILNQSLNSEGYISFQEYVESDEYQCFMSTDTPEKKMQEIAFEQFMARDVDLD